MTIVSVNNILIGENQPLVFILGPCVIESRDHAMQMAEKLKELSQKLGFPLIYKSSFDKANRSDIESYRGPGIEAGLKILAEVKKQFDLPILTDVHEPFQAEEAGKVVDVLQIPAFLCRQTDLILAVARTGQVVNVKKGQFIAPADINNIVRKIESTGNRSILLTDRGVTFGYGGLITDIRAVPIMQKTGYPVIFDATHSAQIPGGQVTSGAREYIPHLSRAMVAAGCNGIFMEVHDDVVHAQSDRATQYPLDKLPKLITELMQLGTLVRQFL